MVHVYKLCFDTWLCGDRRAPDIWGIHVIGIQRYSRRSGGILLGNWLIHVHLEMTIKMCMCV